jgi:formylglycine-generating enzyme required for sulfatase activity
MSRALGLISMAFRLAALIAAAPASATDRIVIDGFAIDRTETTIARFADFAAATGRITAAEREGGGFEYAGGWQRRSGWNFRTPFGTEGMPDEPAVHVSWTEARDFCAWAGGRLPTQAQWLKAAYTERRAKPSDGFEQGRSYRYPVGDDPVGMNTAGDDPWPRLARVGQTRRGVNGLFDMGANAWEWLEDRRGADALTAGGSWWYGPAQTLRESMQWKDHAFAAVYIGFRCIYSLAD